MLIEAEQMKLLLQPTSICRRLSIDCNRLLSERRHLLLATLPSKPFRHLWNAIRSLWPSVGGNAKGHSLTRAMIQKSELLNLIAHRIMYLLFSSLFSGRGLVQTPCICANSTQNATEQKARGGGGSKTHICDVGEKGRGAHKAQNPGHWARDIQPLQPQWGRTTGGWGMSGHQTHSSLGWDYKRALAFRVSAEAGRSPDPHTTTHHVFRVSIPVMRLKGTGLKGGVSEVVANTATSGSNWEASSGGHKPVGRPLEAEKGGWRGRPSLQGGGGGAALPPSSTSLIHASMALP